MRWYESWRIAGRVVQGVKVKYAEYIETPFV